MLCIICIYKDMFLQQHKTYSSIVALVVQGDVIDFNLGTCDNFTLYVF